jgi:hypothetical protein
LRQSLAEAMRSATKWRGEKNVLSDELLVLETPFENLDGFITPTKSFYRRISFALFS